MSAKRTYYCPYCTKPLGDKVPKGLKDTRIIVEPPQTIFCVNCGSRTKARIAFSYADARENGLANYFKREREEKIPKGGRIEWDVLQLLHETDGLEVIPMADGSLCLRATPNSRVALREMRAHADTITADSRLSPQQKLKLLQEAAEAIMDEMPQEETASPVASESGACGANADNGSPAPSESGTKGIVSDPVPTACAVASESAISHPAASTLIHESAHVEMAEAVPEAKAEDKHAGSSMGRQDNKKRK